MAVPSPDRRFHELTLELLASLAPDEVGSAVVQHVLLRIGPDPAHEAEIVRALPRGVQAIYTTWLVDAEVNEGGFNRFFFFTSSRRFAGDALAGYELMGAEEHAAVMRAAIATHETERERLAPFREAGTPEALAAADARTALGEVDQRYYALGDRIHDVWAAFVRERPALLIG